MDSHQSFSTLIDLWPSAADLARDIGVKEVTARAWKARGVPAQYWTRILTSAERFKVKGVTLELLASLASREAT